MSDQHDYSLRSEIDRFRYKYKPNENPEKSASDVRNALLVVATLIAAVTFQAGVNPPGGVWQEKYPPPNEAPPPTATPFDRYEDSHEASAPAPSSHEAPPPTTTPFHRFEDSHAPGKAILGKKGVPNEDSHEPGKAILGKKGVSYAFFLLSNTAAFSTSGIIIGILIQGFPFYYLVWLALLSMVCTYAASISAVLPDKAINKVYLYIAFLLPFILLIVRHLWRRIKALCAMCWSCICCCCTKK